MNKEKLKQLIQVLMTTPSGDNAQVWNFIVKGDTLIVEYDQKRGAHILNCGNAATYISLGCLISTLELTCSQLGLNPEIKMNLENLEEIAVVKFTETSVKEDPLAKFMSIRETNRSVFSKSEFPKDRLQDVKEIVRPYGVGLYIIDKPNEDAFNYFKDGEVFVFHNKNVFKQTIDWVRFTSYSKNKTRDGMSLSNVFLNPVEGLFTYLMYLFDFLRPLFYSLAIKREFEGKCKKYFNQMTGVFCFTTKKLNNEGLVDVGRAAFKVWTYLNSRGYGVQPMTASSLLPFCKKLGISFEGLNEVDLSFIDRGDQIYSNSLILDNEENVAWSFRVGKSPALKPHQRTLRRPLSLHLTEAN